MLTFKNQKNGTHRAYRENLLVGQLISILSGFGWYFLYERDVELDDEEKIQVKEKLISLTDKSRLNIQIFEELNSQKASA